MSRLRKPFTLCALLAGLLIPATAGADPGSLTPRLDALAGKDLRNAPRVAQADALSLSPRGAGSLTRDGERIVVQARTSGDPHASLDALRDAGAEITDVYAPIHTITLSVREQELRAVGAIAGVESVEEVIAPMSGADLEAPAAHPRDGVAARVNDTCATGSFVSEALSQLRADAARSSYDVDGRGVKVGVLSDSYSRRAGPATTAAQDVASGDLPGPGNPCGRTTPVQVVDDTSMFSKADEGRAMLQAVHDVAPGAALAFATAENSDSSFTGNILDLANVGADVIVDDYTYFSEPFYQDGIIAKAVTDVTSVGIPYFSMAFNNNRRIAGNDSNSWEAPAYRPTTCPAAVNDLPAANPTDCMDFNPGAPADNQFGLTATGGGTTLRFDMQWAQPWFGVNTDFNLYLVSVAPNPDEVVASSTIVNATTQKPFEFAVHAPANTAAFNYQVVIGRMAGSATPRIKWVNADNGAGSIAALEYPVSAAGDTVGPTIFGHNGSTSAQTVGAVPFSDASIVEDYSSRGPVTHVFGPVNGLTPAAPLPGPQITAKPDVVATDGGQNTFFGPDFGGGLFRFFGTSQAAPHAAAVAALQIDAEPSITQQEVKEAQKSSATPIPGFGPLAAGAGLIDAKRALIAGDETAPTLLITKKPRRKAKSRKAKFEFLTDHNATLECSLDGKRPKPCAAKTSFEVKVGKHRLIVQANDPAGNLTAANYSWKVKKRKR